MRVARFCKYVMINPVFNGPGLLESRKPQKYIKGCLLEYYYN
jgi:sulfate permease, SulP family